MSEQTIIVKTEKNEGNGLAVAGLVLGIIAVVLNLIPFLPYLLGILAIIFGGVGMRKEEKRKMAIASIVLGIVSILMKILFWIFLFGIGSSL